VRLASWNTESNTVDQILWQNSKLKLADPLTYGVYDGNYIILANQETVVRVNVLTQNIEVLGSGLSIIGGMLVDDYVYCLRSGLGLVCYEAESFFNVFNGNKLQHVAEQTFSAIQS